MVACRELSNIKGWYTREVKSMRTENLPLVWKKKDQNDHRRSWTKKSRARITRASRTTLCPLSGACWCHVVSQLSRLDTVAGRTPTHDSLAPLHIGYLFCQRPLVSHEFGCHSAFVVACNASLVYTRPSGWRHLVEAEQVPHCSEKPHCCQCLQHVGLQRSDDYGEWKAKALEL
jgi:hypothetical protein